MSDGSGLLPDEGQAKTILYRPDAEGGLEAFPAQGDYRDQLRSRRWKAAPLKNAEVEKTDPRIAIGAVVLLALITFALLIAGYGVLGIWSSPA